MAQQVQSNQQYVPSAGGNFVDWSRNVTPAIQNWTDLNKYKMQQQDENQRQAMIAMLQSGVMQPQPSASGTTQFAGGSYYPLTFEQQMMRSGKYMEAMKNYYDMQKTIADTQKTGLETQQMGNFVSQPGNRPVLANIGGVMSVPQPPQATSSGNFLTNMFKGKGQSYTTTQQGILQLLRQKYPGVGDDILVNSLKQTGQWPTS